MHSWQMEELDSAFFEKLRKARQFEKTSKERVKMRDKYRIDAVKVKEKPNYWLQNNMDEKIAWKTIFVKKRTHFCS